MSCRMQASAQSSPVKTPTPMIAPVHIPTERPIQLRVAAMRETERQMCMVWMSSLHFWAAVCTYNVQGGQHDVKNIMNPHSPARSGHCVEIRK